MQKQSQSELILERLTNHDQCRAWAANLVDGRATLTLPVFTTKGTKTIRIQYAGDAFTSAASITANVRVVKK